MSRQERPVDRHRDVVVGVDGSRAGTNAVRYAVAEAVRRGTRVHAVHAVEAFVPIAPTYGLPLDDMLDAGRSVMRSSLDRAGTAAGSVPLTTTVATGGAVAELVSVGEDAAVVVLGADRRSVAARFFTGDVSTGVAARSAVPVVVVPETWPSHDATGVVLVGVKRPDRSEALLAAAFELAQTRGSRLLVVHAWRLPSAYDDIIGDRVAYEEWDGRARVELEECLAEWRSAYPDVDVEVRAVHDQAAHALVAASYDVDEVVLVRRARGIHLGATARAVMAHSDCPVRIVPADHVLRMPDLSLEDSGALSR